MSEFPRKGLDKVDEFFSRVDAGEFVTVEDDGTLKTWDDEPIFCPWCKEPTHREPIPVDQDSERWAVCCFRCLSTGPAVIPEEWDEDDEDGYQNAASKLAWDAWNKEEDE